MLSTEESRITLAQAASRYPGSRGAARLHPATLTRHILRGVRALDGRIVRLEAERLGCRWFTSEAAMQRFATALAADPMPTPPVQTPRSESARMKASAAAGRKLAAMGA